MRAGSSREEAACPDRRMRFAGPAVLALSVLLLCRGIAAPFNGWHDLNSAMYAQFARNHVQ
jgi:hypothetical protein